VLLLAGVAVHFYLSARRTAGLWEQAQQALDRQDLPAACDLLRQYLDARPGSAEGHFLLAQTLRRDGQFDPAERHLSEARRLGWDLDAVRREADLADLQRRGVREMPGRELSALVRQLGPQKPLLEALYRGDLALRNWDRAGYWLHLWLENSPDDWAPRLWQAELLERFKKYDRARADYLRVLELRPDHPRALLGVGLVALANRGDYTEAESYLGRYLEKDPGHPEARLGLARCRLGRGDLAGARESARRVWDDNPGHAGAALLLGTIEREAERYAEAEHWLRLGESVDRQGVSYQLSQVLRPLGREKEADEYHRKFTELREAHRAVESALRAAEREPKNAQRQYEVGQRELTIGEEELAANWFLQALKVDPDHKPSHAALADYYGRQSDPESATRAQFHRRRAQADR
jgi:tetratricopeptide (TPR) repeat protein